MTIRIAEPKAEMTLTPQAVKDFCALASNLTNAGADGTIPLAEMSHEERVELAARLDDFRDRLSNVSHQKHTRIVSWAQNRGALVKILYTAINTTRAMISKLDENIPARAKAPDLSRDVVAEVFGL